MSSRMATSCTSCSTPEPSLAKPSLTIDGTSDNFSADDDDSESWIAKCRTTRDFPFFVNQILTPFSRQFRHPSDLEEGA
jgi:hypothetical protein